LHPSLINTISIDGNTFVLFSNVRGIYWPILVFSKLKDVKSAKNAKNHGSSLALNLYYSEGKPIVE